MQLVKINDATFTNYTARLVPYLGDATLYQLFGYSESLSLANQALSGLGSTVAGTPSYSAGYSTISPLNGFVSGVPASASPFTHVVIIRPDILTMFCGNWHGATSKFANALFVNGSNIELAINGSPSGANLALSATDEYHFIAGTHDLLTATVYDGSSGVLSSASNASAVNPSAGATAFRVGANGFGGGSARVAAAMSFSTVLSATQLGDLYAYFRAELPKRGISVR